MSGELEVILRRLIAREHPRWTWDQIVVVVQAAEAGRGPHAIFPAGPLATNGG